MDNLKTGAFIKQKRKEKNMTQKELGDLLNITDRAISKWERGLCAPDIALLEPLAEALDVTIIDIIKGECLSTYTLQQASIDVLDYSKNDAKMKMKKWIGRVVVVLVVLVLFVPIGNGISGNGFAWNCLPARSMAKKASKALIGYDEDLLQEYLMIDAMQIEDLVQLKEEGVVITDYNCLFQDVRLEDGYLLVEVDYYILYENQRYQIRASGTYQDGKIGFQQIFAGGIWEDMPEAMQRIQDALCNY